MSLAALVVLILIGVGVIALVQGGGSGSPAPTSAQSAPLPQTTPSPASTQSTLSPGDHTLSVSVDGRNRTLILHVPPTHSGTGPLPLVLVFHGALDTAGNTESSTDFDQVADTRGMLVAFMQGYDNTWNEGAGHTPAEQAGVDDVAFVSTALAAIEQQVSVDPARVAAAGFSNGALLADLLGCRLAASIHLIVPVAGPLPVSVASSCAPSQPVSVLEIHGTADTSIPYNGGAFAGVGGGTTVLSAPDAVARWASIDGCQAGPTTSSIGTGVRVTAYSGCSNSAAVSLRTLVGANHAWPSDIGELVATALGAPG